MSQSLPRREALRLALASVGVGLLCSCKSTLDVEAEELYRQIEAKAAAIQSISITDFDRTVQTLFDSIDLGDDVMAIPAQEDVRKIDTTKNIGIIATELIQPPDRGVSQPWAHPIIANHSFFRLGSSAENPIQNSDDLAQYFKRYFGNRPRFSTYDFNTVSQINDRMLFTLAVAERAGIDLSVVQSFPTPYLISSHGRGIDVSLDFPMPFDASVEVPGQKTLDRDGALSLVMLTYGAELFHSSRAVMSAQELRNLQLSAAISRYGQGQGVIRAYRKEARIYLEMFLRNGQGEYFNRGFDLATQCVEKGDVTPIQAIGYVLKKSGSKNKDYINRFANAAIDALSRLEQRRQEYTNLGDSYPNQSLRKHAIAQLSAYGENIAYFLNELTEGNGDLYEKELERYKRTVKEWRDESRKAKRAHGLISFFRKQTLDSVLV